MTGVAVSLEDSVSQNRWWAGRGSGVCRALVDGLVTWPHSTACPLQPLYLSVSGPSALVVLKVKHHLSPLETYRIQEQ